MSVFRAEFSVDCSTYAKIKNEFSICLVFSTISGDKLIRILITGNTFYAFFEFCVGPTAPTSGFGSRGPDFWNQLVELYKIY